jgi:LacI family transcriptional regulator, galactose operon repressor
MRPIVRGNVCANPEPCPWDVAASVGGDTYYGMPAHGNIWLQSLPLASRLLNPEVAVVGGQHGQAAANSRYTPSARTEYVANTLKELSQSLGLSTSTVSRALSGRDFKRASTRAQVERILERAAELGYEPNGLARSLKTQRRQVVGLILPDILNDYYAAAATLVQTTLADAGYQVILCVTSDEPAVEAAQRRLLREERVAGMVVVPSPQRTPGPARSNVRSTPPIVELVRHSADSTDDAVLIDDVDAGRQGTQHLLDLGHQRIAVLTGPISFSTSRLRLDGYRQALVAAHIPIDESLIQSGPYRRDAARLATRVLLAQDHRATAIIATSNELVIGALQALGQSGIRVPDDLSLVGFGNADWFELLRPALTTVALPIQEMAMVAAHMLLKRIRLAAGAEPASDTPPVVARYQAHLVVRDSTRPMAISYKE